MKQKGWLCGVLVGFSFCLFGCACEGYPIRFVLPKGYQGTFKLALDRRKGKGLQLKGGRYTIVIPKKGVLKVKTFEPLYIRHRQEAFYADGTRIPNGLQGDFCK
ncbi:MAG: hypothetical protein LKKZDAJK_002870 [Candidatus Fervidibacter sp.]